MLCSVAISPYIVRGDTSGQSDSYSAVTGRATGAQDLNNFKHLGGPAHVSSCLAQTAFAGLPTVSPVCTTFGQFS